MSRQEQLKADADAFWESKDLPSQRYYARRILVGCHVTGDDMHPYFTPKFLEDAKSNTAICESCGKEFKNQHALRAHRGRKHKNQDERITN